MLSYRPHIDGLRTIAVLLVVLFHMNASLFSGGYLGVDVFFVISGFVITQSLYKDYCTNGRINIFMFYLRRFRRLYPALIFMLLVTTSTYIFWGYLWDTNLYLKSAFATLFASSNLYFLFHGDNYFQQDLINPLTHTWSLGVEEQFYVLYPMLLAFGLMMVRKYKLSIQTLAYVVLAVSIFLFVIFASGKGGLFSEFYFPFARFWELGIGCALCLLTVEGVGNRLATPLAILGVLILVAIQFLPVVSGILPLATGLTVIATSGIVYAGLGQTGFITDFLSRSLMVYFGKLSYSLYLWHLPVIYYANLYVPPTLFPVVVLSVSVSCAMVSYHFVENPLRYSQFLNSLIVRAIKLSPVAIIIIAVCVGVIGAHQTRTVINTGFNDFGKFIGDINYIEKNFALGERIQPDFFPSSTSTVDCQLPIVLQELQERDETKSLCLKLNDATNSPLFYLVGDSHAMHFVPALYASRATQNLLFKQSPSNIIVASRAQDFDEKKAQEEIDRQVNELQKLNTRFPDIYYVVSFFLTPKKSQVDTIERNLHRYIQALDPYATIIFIAPTPIFSGGPESCVILEKHCSIVRADDLEAQQPIIDMLKRLDEAYDSVFVFDPYPSMCPDTLCRNYIRETDTLLYIDDDHISPEQSTKIAPAFDVWWQNTFDALQ